MGSWNFSSSINEGENMEKIFKVTGMHCKSCEILLMDVLSEIKAVSQIAIDHKSGTVKFSYDNEAVLPDVKKAIEAEGYKVL